MKTYLTLVFLILLSFGMVYGQQDSAQFPFHLPGLVSAGSVPDVPAGLSPSNNVEEILPRAKLSWDASPGAMSKVCATNVHELQSSNESNFITIKKSPAPASTSDPAPVIVGKGCTTAYYIDKDCDGYGVNAPLGADADDNDKTVNTPATMLSKYGTLKAFLKHKGYPTDRLFFVSTTGNDKTAVIGDPNHPYATWAAIHKLVGPGDVVLFRGGTYTGKNFIMGQFPSIHGSEGKPIVIMAYPGEKPIFDGPAGTPINFWGCQYVIVDGLTGRNSTTYEGRGFSLAESKNITVRNCDMSKATNGLFAMQGMDNFIVEGNVFHDLDANPNGTHGIYIGARGMVNHNVIVRDNLIYNCRYTGFQHNGRVDGLLVEGNIIHSTEMAALSLEMGGNNVTVRNNLFFQNQQSVVVFWYNSTPAIPGDPGVFAGDPPGINPYDMSNFKFYNNTFYKGKYYSCCNGSGGTTKIGTDNYHAAFTIGENMKTNGASGYATTAWKPNTMYTYKDSVLPTVVVDPDYDYVCAKKGTHMSGPKEPKWTRHNADIIYDGDTAWIVRKKPNISGFKIINNIFYMPGWNSAAGHDYVFYIQQPRFWQPGHCPEIRNNIIYRASNPVDQGLVMRFDNKAYNFNAFQAFNPAQIHGNLYADPLFENTNPNYFSSIGSFNFMIRASSPAIDFGTDVGVEEDLKGNARVLPPDAGCYERQPDAGGLYP